MIIKGGRNYELKRFHFNRVDDCHCHHLNPCQHYCAKHNTRQGPGPVYRLCCQFKKPGYSGENGNGGLPIAGFLGGQPLYQGIYPGARYQRQPGVSCYCARLYCNNTRMPSWPRLLLKCLQQHGLLYLD